ncbi:hypothetical protein COLO4_16287 [Corchorus olitorius]|uniref:Uncharacterized protein n=1 Tax=Corchorus olitorius TaxID=93759 RepID=A0A1R3JID5_9ROSI|nr:hypothetical protein COLO4_16287 [Corchorus olitorius]
MRAGRRCVLCAPNGERAWEGRWESRISLELLIKGDDDLATSMADLAI